MIPVKERIARGAKVSSLEEYRELYRESIEDPEGFWREQAERLDWFHPFDTVARWDFREVDFSLVRGRPAQRLLQLRRPPRSRRGRATAGDPLGRRRARRVPPRSPTAS